MKDKMNFIARTAFFVLGMFVCSYGIALTTRGNLGTSPISSPPYVVTFFTPFTFGLTTFVANALFLVGQVIILKKEFPPIQIVQLLTAFIIGVFMDISMHYTQIFHSDVYWHNMAMVVVGSAILGLGVAMEIFANVTYMPGDGLVNVIYEKTQWNLGKIKVGFDVLLVLISIVISYAFLHRIEGVREGTIVSALLVGIFVNWFLDMMKAIAKMVKKET